MAQLILKCLVLMTVTFVSGRPQESNNNLEKSESRLHYLYFPTHNDQVEIIYNDTQSLVESNLKPSTKTLLLLDGFTSFATSPMNLETKNTFSGRQDTNVIIVDWSTYSGFGHPVETVEEGLVLYFYVLMLQMPKAASELADFIQFLYEHGGINYSDITIIGHSLGGHTAGATGRASKAKYNSTVGRIVAQDPALQFSIIDSFVRLRIGDASVVEIYTTNRELAGDMYPATGDVIIYVNGGDNQPCDPTSSAEDKADDIGLLCYSHSYSYKIYNYLVGNDTIRACPCQGAMCLCQGCEFECGDKGISIGPHIPENARGSYHVKTGHVDWGY